jgi:nucleotide-binding universal stress UspA family protein
MYQRILVPTDGTELCAPALDTALALAAAGGGAIVGLHAAAPARLVAVGADDPVRAAWLNERHRLGADALAWIARRADEAGVPCETLLTHHETPAEAIVLTARERRCDLIVMASRGRGFLRARLPGGETWKVLTHCAVPVLVLR